MDTFFNERIISALKYYVRFAVIISVFISLLVLLGWALDITIFKTAVPGLVSMRPITALSFLLVSGALCLLSDENLPVWRRRLGFLLAGLVIVLGALILLEYIFSWNIGIDFWFFRDAIIKEGGLDPGRPAPATVISLLLLGATLLTLHRRSAWLTSFLTMPVFMVGLLVIVGYAFGVSSFYRIEPHDSMALHTALILLLLASATLSIFPQSNILSLITTDLAGGISARRMLPAAILVPFVLGWLEIVGQRLGLFGPQFGLAFYSTLNMVIFVGFILVIGRSLNQAELRRTLAMNSQREMESQYRRIVEQTPAIVYVDEIGGKWRYISPQVESILGYKVEQWLADPSIFKSRIHQADRERVYQQIAESESTGRPFVCEYRFLTSDGNVLWLHDEAAVVRDPSTGKILLQGVMANITDRKLAEQNLRALEARYRMLVEQLPTMVYINPINNIGVTTYISPQIETFLGYTPKEWLADPKFWTTILHPDDCQRVLAQVERISKSGEPFDEEYRLFAKDGRVVWIHDRATLLHDSKGNPLFWQGLMIDLTERKQAEQEREAKLVLEAKNAELDRFAYTVSHDLKSPLVTIQGFLNYFRKDLASGHTERVMTDLKYVENAVNKMQELLTGVLALSRAGMAVQEPKRISFDELVQETLELLAVTLESNQAQVNVHQNLPVVLGDQIRLRQVLQNLIENAVKYCSVERLPIIEIGAGGNDELGNPILFVRDNGMGIPSEYQDQIFDLFHKVDSKSDGSGVGLATVKRIIEVHNGRIWVESEVGKGSTFYFTLHAQPGTDSVI